MRYLKIINPLRFQRAVALIVAVMCLLCFACYKMNCEERRVYEIHRVTVHEGDTVWTIADDYNDQSIDVRYAINTLREINGLDGDIHPGEVIYVPVFR